MQGGDDPPPCGWMIGGDGARRSIVIEEGREWWVEVAGPVVLALALVRARVRVLVLELVSVLVLVLKGGGGPVVVQQARDLEEKLAPGVLQAWSVKQAGGRGGGGRRVPTLKLGAQGADSRPAEGPLVRSCATVQKVKRAVPGRPGVARTLLLARAREGLAREAGGQDVVPAQRRRRRGGVSQGLHGARNGARGSMVSLHDSRACVEWSYRGGGRPFARVCLAGQGRTGGCPRPRSR